MWTKHNAQHSTVYVQQDSWKLAYCLQAGRKGREAWGRQRWRTASGGRCARRGNILKVSVCLFVCLSAVRGDTPWYGCGSQMVNLKNQLLPLTLLGRDLPIPLLAAAPGAPAHSPTSAFCLIIVLRIPDVHHHIHIWLLTGSLGLTSVNQACMARNFAH